MRTLPLDSPEIDIAHTIDASPIGAFQTKIVLMCAAILFADGFDTQAIGFVAPELTRLWHIPRPALGPVFSAGLLGLMLGALVFSPIADRIGRKRIVVLSTAWFAVATLATIFAHDTTTLIAIRFVTGLGLGGAMPNAVALTAEYSPHRRRATLVMFAFCGFSLGAAIGGLIAAALIPRFGWQSVFLVGGLVPLLFVPLLALRLPESIRFLTLQGAHDKVAALLHRIDPTTQPGARFRLHEERPAGLPVLRLFDPGRALPTILIWIVFFMSLLDLYFLSNWLPTVLADLGASVSAAALIASMLQVGGFVSVLALGRVMDRFSFAGLALVYGLAAIAIALVGQSSHSIWAATTAIFAAGFCVVGAQTAANALVAAYYPTLLRSTGIGWALGIGRIGSIVGPLLGGALLAMHWSAPDLFLLAAIPAVIATIASAGLWRILGRTA